MKLWGKAFKGLGNDFSDAFFDSMFRDHKLMPALGEGISKAWSGGNDWRRKVAMAGAGALMAPAAIKTAEGVGEGMRESPIATSLVVGGAAVGLAFGASSAAKSFTKKAISRRADSYALKELNSANVKAGR
jgi:hypothetical protein